MLLSHPPDKTHRTVTGTGTRQNSHRHWNKAVGCDCYQQHGGHVSTFVKDRTIAQFFDADDIHTLLSFDQQQKNSC